MDIVIVDFFILDFEQVFAHESKICKNLAKIAAFFIEISGSAYINSRVTFPKISYYTRKKQFFEIWSFHSPVVTSLS